MKAQVTITVNGGKGLISKAIIEHPAVKTALKKGTVILKGGTTVSLIAEKLVGVKLRISGRITKRGTVGSLNSTNNPHSILIKNNQWQDIDNNFLEKVLELGPEDVIIVGANAIDCNKNAAMMAGSPGGGNPGKAFTALTTEGAKVIIAAGLEKLVPTDISDILKQASRKSCDLSMGMAVGLMPIYGDLVTEIEALKLLYGIKATIIGKGGIEGAEGSTTFIIEGEKDSIKKALKEIIRLNSEPLSIEKNSLVECKTGSPGCKYHLACIYSNKRNRG